MSGTDPKVLPVVPGVRNPRRQAVGAALAGVVVSRGLSVRCLWKVVKDVPGGTRRYPRLLGIVGGAIDPTVTELSVLCDTLNIPLERLITDASTNK